MPINCVHLNLCMSRMESVLQKPLYGSPSALKSICGVGVSKLRAEVVRRQGMGTGSDETNSTF